MRPEVGMRVVTADGHVIGRISVVQDDCFKVDIPMWPDHWMALDSIEEVDEGRVLLGLSANDLGESVKEGIGHTGFHVHEEAMRDDDAAN